MKLTKKDAHICQILFDQSTHDMAIAMYGDRAKKIWRYFRNWLKGKMIEIAKIYTNI